MNISPIIIDDRPHMDKRACYTPDLLPAAISVASEKSVITFTNTYDSSEHLSLTSDDTNHSHTTHKDKPYRGRVKKAYCYKKRDGKICKKTSFYCSTWSG